MINLKNLALVVFLMTMFLGNERAFSQTLNYGDEIRLQNGWNKFNGGFLDTRGYQKDYEKTGNHLCVSTALSENRDAGSGTWKVISATGKPNGSPVLIGDEVHLQNAWNKYNGGYLDTRGYQRDYEKTGNHLCVSTALSSNRDAGSGIWKISSAQGKAAGTPVENSALIHLQNGWNQYNGGFLDTRGYQKDYEQTGNHLCVSTALVNNRDLGSGTWKVATLKTTKNYLNAGERLNPGEKLFSQNGAFMLRMQEEDGNLCVYTSKNGVQGTFVWGAYQAMKYTLAAGHYLVMQTDGNLCIYNKANGFQWGSYQVKNYPLISSADAMCKLVLTDDGKLNILDPAGKVIWTN